MNQSKKKDNKWIKGKNIDVVLDKNPPMIKLDCGGLELLYDHSIQIGTMEPIFFLCLAKVGSPNLS